MAKKLTKHGNSLALVIEKPILDLLKIGPDTLLDISTDGEGLHIRPVEATGREKRFQEASQRAHQRYGSVFKRLAK